MGPHFQVDEFYSHHIKKTNNVINLQKYRSAAAAGLRNLPCRSRQRPRNSAGAIQPHPIHRRRTAMVSRLPRPRRRENEQ